MENKARACGLFSVRTTENFAQFRVFPDSGMRRRQNFPDAAPPSRHASGLPDSAPRFPGPGCVCFRSMLQPFVFKASSVTKKNLQPLRCGAIDRLPLRAGKRPRRAAFFFNKSVDIAKTLDLAFTCVPRESSRVIKTSPTIRVNAIDCSSAIEQISSLSKNALQRIREIPYVSSTRPRPVSGVRSGAGSPASPNPSERPLPVGGLPELASGHCSTWAFDVTHCSKAN